MHPIEHNLDNHSNYRTKTRLDKIKHLRSIANRESICYHESGHTVMSILLHGGYEYQIQHRFGGLSISTGKNIHHESLTALEILGMLLAGFAAQKLQRINHHDENHGEKMLDYSLEHNFTPGLGQPDTLIALHILRKEYKKLTGKKLSPGEQERYLREWVNKIAIFFSKNIKLFRLIKLLSRINEREPVLDRKTINKCIEKAGITGEDIVALGNEFRNSGILNFNSFSSPQSSLE